MIDRSSITLTGMDRSLLGSLLLLPLLLLTVSCGQPPERNVHPPGVDVTDHEMFRWIVGRCLETDMDLYAIESPNIDADRKLMGDLEAKRFDGFLTRPGYNGGPATPADFEAGKKIYEDEALVAHYLPGTRFEVDTVIKVDNPLDAPSYHYVVTLPVPESQSMRLQIRPLLGSGAFPMGFLTPEERQAQGEPALHESIHFCDDDE